MKNLYLPTLATLVFFFISASLPAQERIPVVPVDDPPEYTDVKKWAPSDGTLCVPEYSAGCGYGDGFTDFAVEEIENYGSGCADLNGTGWSQYLGLGPAILFPGLTHDFIMKTGYGDQFVTIWIDFNDDFDLTADEIILLDFEMVSAGQFYTASVPIPEDAIPGMHYMRARTNWLGSSNDPCQEYTYGEAEDYYVVIGMAEAGAIEGYVTELDGGTPVEDAVITLEGMVSYSAASGSDGYYFIDYVFVGDYDLTCFRQGYNVQNLVITIEEDITLTQDFALTQPQISVDPLVVTVTLPPGATSEEYGTIENDGNGQLDWGASIQLAGDKSKGFLDLQFQYPVAQGGGEAGVESDGNFLYTTKWNGGAIYAYDLQGNYMESFTIAGVSGLRDLAYDGIHFYGSAAIPVVWEMDFENKELVSSFTAPTSVRAIAYNDDEDVFYANNFSSTIIKFDKSGNNLGGFEVGPTGENYYGFAYDAVSVGGPYLWGYAQTGESNNEIVQIQLPSGTETGLYVDMETKLAGNLINAAGGLYTHPNLVFGKWTLGGLVQNEWNWGLELADAQTWLWIEPNSGSLSPGSSQDLSIQFDATGLEPGEYQAGIHFNSWPEVGNPVIEVTLVVSENAYFPCDLISEVNCTDVGLSWSVCPSGSPDADSFYVYREDVFLHQAIEPFYTDSMIDPEVTYSYKVTAFYGGIETNPSTELEVVVPLPDDLEPTNLQVVFMGNLIGFNFDPPAGCLAPAAYNLYRDGILFATSSTGTFQTGLGNHEYFITAVYYFGESGPSNTILITSVAEVLPGSVKVYPNPAKDHLNIEAGYPVINLQFIDLQGRILFQAKPGSVSYAMNLSDFKSGLYTLMITLENEFQIRKILIL
jgi:hypothetical protein